MWASSNLRAAEFPRLGETHILDRQRGEIRQGREFGGMLRREPGRPSSPDLQSADHLILRQQRHRKRRLDALGPREAEEVSTDDLAVNVILDRARLAGLEHASCDTLPGAHAQRRRFGGEVSDASLHDKPVVFLEHDSANVRRETDLGFVGNLSEDLVEIAAFQDAVGNSLKDLDRFEFVRIPMPAFARS